MGNGATHWDITETTGTSGLIPADPNKERKQIILQTETSGGRVHLGFNEDAIYGEGIYMDAGYSLILDGNDPKINMEINMVCLSGQTMTVYGVTL